MISAQGDRFCNRLHLNRFLKMASNIFLRFFNCRTQSRTFLNHKDTENLMKQRRNLMVIRNAFTQLILKQTEQNRRLASIRIMTPVQIIKHIIISLGNISPDQILADLHLFFRLIVMGITKVEKDNIPGPGSKSSVPVLNSHISRYNLVQAQRIQIFPFYKVIFTTDIFISPYNIKKMFFGKRSRHVESAALFTDNTRLIFYHSLCVQFSN